MSAKVIENLFLNVSCDFLRMKAKTLCLVWFGFSPSFLQTLKVLSCTSRTSHIVTQDFRTCHLYLFVLQSLPPSLSLSLPLDMSFLNLGAEKEQAQSLLVQETPAKKLPTAEKARLSQCTLLSKLNKDFEALAGKGSLCLILYPSGSQYGVKSSQGDDANILSILKCGLDQLL